MSLILNVSGNFALSHIAKHIIRRRYYADSYTDLSKIIDGIIITIFQIK